MPNKTVYTVARECNIDIVRRDIYDSNGTIIGRDTTFLSIVSTGVLVETYFYDSEKTVRREAWYPVNKFGELHPLVEALEEQNLIDMCNWFFAHSNVAVVRYDDVNIESGAIAVL